MTIRLKFSLIGIPLLIAASSLVYFGALHFQKRQALLDLESEIQMMGDLATYNLAFGLPANNRGVIPEVIQSLRQNQDLAYVIILDKSGNIIGQYRKALADQVNYRSIGENALSDDKSILKGKSIIQRQDQMLGELYLGLTLDSIRRGRVVARRNLLIVALVNFPRRIPRPPVRIPRSCLISGYSEHRIH